MYVWSKRLEEARSNDPEHVCFENDLNRILFDIIVLANDPVQVDRYPNIGVPQLGHLLVSLWIAEHDNIVRQNVASLLSGLSSLPLEEGEAERLDLLMRDGYGECRDVGVVKKCIALLAQSCLRSGKRNIAVLARLLFVTRPNAGLGERSEADPWPEWRLTTARRMARRAVGEQQVGKKGRGEPLEGGQTEGGQTEGQQVEVKDEEDAVDTWLD